MNTTEVGIVILFLVSFLLGLQATVTLWRMAAAANPRLIEPRAYLVLRAFVLVSVIVTIACAYFGILTARRLFGFDAIDGIQLVSLVVVAIVVQIPQILLQVVRRVADADAPQPLTIPDAPEDGSDGS